MMIKIKGFVMHEAHPEIGSHVFSADSAVSQPFASLFRQTLATSIYRQILSHQSQETWDQSED